MSASTVAWAVLQLLLYPIFLLLHFIFRLLATASAPIVHVIRHTWHICSIPFHFLGKFEASPQLAGVLELHRLTEDRRQGSVYLLRHCNPHWSLGWDISTSCVPPLIHSLRP